MNTPTNKNDGLNDDDMHELLRSDSIDTPPALDKAILAAAHDAIAQPSQPDAVSKRWNAYWPQALSAAAVLVLAVVLVPYITSSPHSSLDASIESSLAGEDAKVDEGIMLAEEAASTLTSSSELASAPATESATESAPAPQTMSIEAESTADSTSLIDGLSMDKSASRNKTSSASISARANTSKLKQSDSESSARMAEASVDHINSQQALIARLNGLTYQAKSETRGRADSALADSDSDSDSNSDGDASATPVSDKRLVFMGDTFIWQHQNLVETGTFEFVSEGTFTAILPDRRLLVEFVEGAILWDTVRYEQIK